MPHFHRKTGEAVDLIEMGETATFVKQGQKTPKTVPVHEFNEAYRQGRPYETADDKFDYPANYPEHLKAAPVET